MDYLLELHSLLLFLIYNFFFQYKTKQMTGNGLVTNTESPLQNINLTSAGLSPTLETTALNYLLKKMSKYKNKNILQK